MNPKNNTDVNDVDRDQKYNGVNKEQARIELGLNQAETVNLELAN